MGLDITYTLGSRGVAKLSTVDTRLITANALRPTVDELVDITDETGAIKVFSGQIFNASDRALGDPNVGVVTTIDATDYTRACDGRIVPAQSFAAGFTLKAYIAWLQFNYLAVFGITLDPTMADGPILDAITFDYGTVTAALNRLVTMASNDTTRWAWRLTPEKVLQVFAVGTKTATYSLTSSNAKIIGGVRWTRSRAKKVNRLYLTYGPTAVESKTWLVTGNGTTTTWTLEYPGLQDFQGRLVSRGLVTDSYFAGEVPLGIVGIDPTPWYEFNPATNQIIRTAGPLPSGFTASVVYSVQFPLTLMVEDASAITNPSEDRQFAPDITDTVAATTYAEGLLRRYLAAPRTLTVRTRAGIVLPGDVITLTIPERTVSGSWLVTAVRIHTEVDQKFSYDLTCAEGSEANDSWIDTLRSLFGGSASR